MKKSQFIFGIGMCMALVACHPKTTITSPDGKISVACTLDASGKPVYQVSHNGEMASLHLRWDCSLRRPTSHKVLPYKIQDARSTTIRGKPHGAKIIMW